MSFHQENQKKFFFIFPIYQAQNFALSLPLHKRNEEKPSNIKNLDGTHSAPL